MITKNKSIKEKEINIGIKGDYLTEITCKSILPAIINLIENNNLKSSINIRKLKEGSAKTEIYRADIKLDLSMIILIDKTHNLGTELNKRKSFPKIVRKRFPQIYFTGTNGETRIAVVEYVGKTISQMIYENSENAKSLIVNFIKSTIPLYNSTKINSSVDLERFYLRWIDYRLKLAFDVCKEIKNFTQNKIKYNNSTFNSLLNYINEINKFLEVLEPNFRTFIHGDWWGSNWTFYNNRFYFFDWDPYHLVYGDYLYDFAKIIWWLETTNIGTDPIPSDPYFNSRNELKLSIKKSQNYYKINFETFKPDWVKSTLKEVKKLVKELAEALNDRYWEPRLELAIGSTYLGLVKKSILRYNDINSAIFLYIKGLVHLKNCIEITNRIVEVKK